MIPFDPEILVRLNKECNVEPIYYVGLGRWDFQLAFAGVSRIRNTERVNFYIKEKLQTWKEGPSNIPVWLLIGQTPTIFELINLFVLRMNLASGDYVEFHTDESPYEAMLIEFGQTSFVVF